MTGADAFVVVAHGVGVSAEFSRLLRRGLVVVALTAVSGGDASSGLVE
jgi:hypothetical protein